MRLNRNARKEFVYRAIEDVCRAGQYANIGQVAEGSGLKITPYLYAILRELESDGYIVRYVDGNQYPPKHYYGIGELS